MYKIISTNAPVSRPRIPHFRHIRSIELPSSQGNCTLCKIGNRFFAAAFGPNETVERSRWVAEIKKKGDIRLKREIKFHADDLLGLGDHLLVGVSNRVVRVWDILTDKETSFYSDTPISKITPMNDFQFLAGGKEGHLMVFDIQEKKCILTLPGNYNPKEKPVTSAQGTYYPNTTWALAYSENNLAAIGAKSNSIQVWDLNKKECLYNFSNLKITPHVLLFLTSSHLICGARCGEVISWDLSCSEQMSHKSRSGINTFAQLPNGIVVSGDTGHFFRFWDSRDMEPLGRFENKSSSSNNGIDRIIYFPDHEECITGHMGRKLMQWQVAEPTSSGCIKRLTTQGPPIPGDQL